MTAILTAWRKCRGFQGTSKELTKEIATLQFTDNETGGTGLVIIRVHQEEVILALSQESDGDVQIVLRPEDCQAVIDALQRALALSKEQT